MDRCEPYADYTILRLRVKEQERRALLALGFGEGAVVRRVPTAPSGDPIAFWNRGATVALRKSLLRRIDTAPTR